MSTEWHQAKDLRCLISDSKVHKDCKMLKVHLDSMIKTKELQVLKDGRLNKREEMDLFPISIILRSFKWTVRSSFEKWITKIMIWRCSMNLFLKMRLTLLRFFQKLNSSFEWMRIQKIFISQQQSKMSFKSKTRSLWGKLITWESNCRRLLTIPQYLIPLLELVQDQIQVCHMAHQCKVTW